jgi:subtilase family serine protease
MKKAVVAALLAFASYACAAAGPGSVFAPDRVTSQIDDRVLVSLDGNTHRAARDAANDRGAVEADFAMPHMLLQLKRSAEQEAALQKAMEQMHTPGSPSYHSWFSEQEFDEQYGVSQNDVAKVTAWLEKHGFTVGGITPDGMVVDFSGTASMVREAFHTDIHRLELPGGERHVANMSDPQIPASLATVVVGPTSLSDFMPHADHVARRNVTAAESQTTKNSGPDYTAPNGSGSSYLFTPGDAQTIYNTTPLLAAGYTGKGQTIGLIEDETAYDPDGTGISPDWKTFVDTFGLAKYGGKQTTSFPSGPIFCGQPGDYNDGTDVEVALDIEYASAMAPGANVVVEACQNGYSTFGGLIAIENLVSATKITAPVLSMSYGFCEAGNGAANNAAFSYAYQHGAARGVSIFVSSGDDGARACDDGNAASYYGVGTSGYATTPYNVAVGGTDFGDTYDHTRTTYWNATNNADYSSAKSYIPEIPWNDSCASELVAAFLGYGKTYGATGFCASPLAATLTPQNTLQYIDTVAGSGGPSNCYSGTPDSSGVADGTCAGQPKPSWQKIVGNPNDNVRDIPDVSLFASNGIWGHYIVLCASNPAESNSAGTQPCTGAPDTWSGAGGTSASSPMMAGIQTLINGYTKELAGNPNYLYYSLANTEYGSTGSAACNSTKGTNGTSGCIFHDVTRGDTNTPCTYYNPQTLLAFDCFDVANDVNINAPAGVPLGVDSISTAAYKPTYGTNVGWDFATGIGSVNAWNLAQGFAKVYGSASPFKATVTLTSSVPSFVHGHGPAAISYQATVTGSGTYPTGIVNFTIGNTWLGAVTLEPTSGCSSGGSCAEVATLTYSPSTLAVGVYTITATYTSANENYASAIRQTTLQVVKAGSVVDASALTVSPSPQAAGLSKATFAAKVTSAAGVPDGTVTFTVNAVTKGICTLAKGACSISVSTASEAAGTYSVVAVYSGSATYESSTSAASLVVTKASTNVAASGTSSVEAGGTITLIATVARPTGYTGVPTGSVHFYSSTLLQSTQGIAELDGTGKAVYQQELSGVPAGSYSVIAKYAGDGSDSGSNSATITLVVTKALTEVTLTPSANPVTEGSPVSITAVVSHACCSTVAPSGTVAFSMGTKSLGTLNLSSGSAVLPLSTAGLTPGTYSVVTKYSGDATNQPTARTLSLTVAAPVASSASPAAR